MSGDVTVKVMVIDGTQVHHDGRTYAAGERLDLPKAIADLYAKAGWVQPVPASKAAAKG